MEPGEGSKKTPQQPQSPHSSKKEMGAREREHHPLQKKSEGRVTNLPVQRSGKQPVKKELAVLVLKGGRT